MLHATWDAILAAQPAGDAPDSEGLAKFLRDFFGPLVLVVISIIAGFFLFTREITRFAQFLVVAVLVAIIFYYPQLLEVIAGAIVRALGVET